jgi:hypothetical protein
VDLIVFEVEVDFDVDADVEADVEADLDVLVDVLVDTALKFNLRMDELYVSESSSISSSFFLDLARVDDEHVERAILVVATTGAINEEKCFANAAVHVQFISYGNTS